MGNKKKGKSLSYLATQLIYIEILSERFTARVTSICQVLDDRSYIDGLSKKGLAPIAEICKQNHIILTFVFHGLITLYYFVGLLSCLPL
jgi:hypothetical protein